MRHHEDPVAHRPPLRLIEPEDEVATEPLSSEQPPWFVPEILPRPRAVEPGLR